MHVSLARWSRFFLLTVLPNPDHDYALGICAQLAQSGLQRSQTLGVCSITAAPIAVAALFELVVQISHGVFPMDQC